MAKTQIKIKPRGGNLQALHDPMLGVTIRIQNDSWSTFFPQLIPMLCKYIFTS